MNRLLDPPVEGRFAPDGTATFACEDVLEGVSIQMRFTWSQIRADHPLWRQAFSFDGGASWKENRMMELRR